MKPSELKVLINKYPYVQFYRPLTSERKTLETYFLDSSPTAVNFDPLEVEYDWSVVRFMNNRTVVLEAHVPSVYTIKRNDKALGHCGCTKSLFLALAKLNLNEVEVFTND